MAVNPSQQRRRRGRFARGISPAAQYGITLLAVAAIAVIVGVINADWGIPRFVIVENPGTLFIIAVVGAAVAFGVGPAFVAIAASFGMIGVFYRDQESPQKLVVLLMTMMLVVVLADRQRQARERAERIQARLRAILESMSDAVIIVDATGQPEDLNQSARAMYDAPDRERALAAVTARTDERARRGETILLQRALAGEVDARDEATFSFADGAKRVMSTVANPVRDAAGRIIGAVSVSLDITEARARAEEHEQLLALVEERRKFAQTVFDSVPVGLAVLDASTLVYQAVNPAYVAAAPASYRGRDFFGLTLTEVFPGIRDTDLISQLRAVAEMGITHAEPAFVFAHPERGTTYWDVMLVPLSPEENNRRLVLLQQADVTEQTRNRRNLEELGGAAAQRAAELETVISSLPDGIAIGSAEGRVLQMNAAARRLLGSDILIGQDYQDAAVAFTVRRPDGTLAAPDELPLARAARGEIFSGQEILITTPYGDVFVSCGGAPIRDAAGAITGTIVVWSDITERKRTEGLMTRLGRIVDASSNEVYVLDAHSFQILQANEGAQRNLGYTPDEIATRTLLDITPGLSEETLGMLVAPLRDSEESEVVYELQFARANHTIYPVEMRLYLSRAEMPPVFVAIVQDITERHTAVRQRETLFREIDERRRFAQAVIEAAPAGIAVFAVDDDFTVRIANEQYTQLFDEPWRSRGVVGLATRAFMPDAEATGILTIYRQVRESGEAVLLREFEYSGFARGSAYYDWSLVPLREDGTHLTGLLLLIVDVTERVRSRQRIEELAWDAAQRANELETMLASITDGVIVTDATGHITLENVASQRLLGSEHLAALDGSGGAVPPPLQSVFAETMPLARAMRGETVEDQIVLVRGPDGELTRYLLCSSAPVRAMDGVITGAVAVFRDITAIKQVEQLKDEFISIAAHELRTPLTAIKGYAELLERRLAREAERPREQQSLAVIRKQTDRLTRLVNEMLDVSRIEAGRLQLSREPFDLTALVEETLDNVRVSNDRHRFVLDAIPAVKAFADAARIEQVLINILTNAVTYSPEGSTITVHERVEGDHIVVSVRDQGIGIAPEETPHLFSRFYRAPQAGMMRSGGMGLGLYISREIIERHGGTIAVESEPGVGSTFTFTVPLAGPDDAGEGS